MKVGLAQLNSQEDREANLKAASEAVMRLADDGCDRRCPELSCRFEPVVMNIMLPS